MTYLGTRPILQDELLKYELHHRARIAIKPGITGMWQVSGRSDITDFEEVVRLDGKEGFKAVHEYLVNGGKSCMAGFVLKNTLSDNGGVTRGICKMDENGNLTEVVETKNIVKTADGAEADGVVVDVNCSLRSRKRFLCEQVRILCHQRKLPSGAKGLEAGSSCE